MSPIKSDNEEIKTSEVKPHQKNELQSQLIFLDSQIVAEEVSPKQSKTAKKRNTNDQIKPKKK